MGDTLPTADDQTESLPTTMILDFSVENVVSVPTLKPDVLNSEDGDGGSGRAIIEHELDGLQREDDAHTDADIKEDDAHTDADIKEVDCHSVKESSNKELQLRDDSILLEALQESESVSSLKMEGASVPREELLDEKAGKIRGRLHAPQTKGLPARERIRPNQKLDVKAQISEDVGTKGKVLSSSQATKALRASSSSSSLFKNSSKTAIRAKADGLVRKKESPADGAAPSSYHVLRRSLSSSSRSNFTVPQPFALATDKRASIGGRAIVGDAPSQSQPPRIIGTMGNSAGKDAQVSKKMGSLPMIKALQDESIKPVEDPNATINEDDTESVSSVESKALRVKASVVINANGFSFKCDERAEKRKEFYTKLVEIHTAKEKEISQIQAKTKEEMEAEIKQLRKSLTFKAMPMPMFYREGAPPKVELKKIPTTRAKSPKLGRRSNSMGSNGEGLSDNLPRSEDESDEKTLDQNRPENAKKSLRRSSSPLACDKALKDEAPGSIELESGATPQDLVGASADGISVVETFEKVDTEPAHLSDKEGVPKQSCDNVHVGNGHPECVNITVESEDVNPGQTLTASDSEYVAGFASAIISCKDDDNIKDDRLLNSKDAEKCESSKPKSELANGSKSRTVRSQQQELKEEMHDANRAKTVKKERLKASTPSFRARKGNQSLKQTTKSDLVMTTVVAANVAVQS